ncbi:MAG: hypothetical protein ACTHLW_09430 [Verrucomicrobiota bacterium]
MTALALVLLTAALLPGFSARADEYDTLRQRFARFDLNGSLVGALN